MHTKEEGKTTSSSKISFPLGTILSIAVMIKAITIRENSFSGKMNLIPFVQDAAYS